MQVCFDKWVWIIVDGGQVYLVDLLCDYILVQVCQKYIDDIGELILVFGEEIIDEVIVGGCVVFVCNIGKLCFVSLQDGFIEIFNGEWLQIMFFKVEVGDEFLVVWKFDVDLGDYVWVCG